MHNEVIFQNECNITKMICLQGFSLYKIKRT